MFIDNYLQVIYNYICKKWEIIMCVSFFSLLLLFIFLFILWIIISYYILKWFRKNIDQNLYFNSYTYISKKNLKKYGDLPIKNIYLVRQPINYFFSKLLNIVSFCEYEKQLTLYTKKNNCNAFYPFHTSIIIEVEMSNKFRKHLIIEKNNSININTCYKKYSNQDMIKLKLKKKKITINKLLEKTKKRVGEKKYFNWHIYKNNCQKFTEELLKSIHENNTKYTNFIYQNDFVETLEFPDFNLHILNCSINLFNIYQDITNSYFF